VGIIHPIIEKKPADAIRGLWESKICSHWR